MAINALALDKHAHTGGQDSHCVSPALYPSCHVLALRVSHTLRGQRHGDTVGGGVAVVPREPGSETVSITEHILLEAK